MQVCYEKVRKKFWCKNPQSAGITLERSGTVSKKISTAVSLTGGLSTVQTSDMPGVFAVARGKAMFFDENPFQEDFSLTETRRLPVDLE